MLTWFLLALTTLAGKTKKAQPFSVRSKRYRYTLGENGGEDGGVDQYLLCRHEFTHGISEGVYTRLHPRVKQGGCHDSTFRDLSTRVKPDIRRPTRLHGPRGDQ